MAAKAIKRGDTAERNRLIADKYTSTPNMTTGQLAQWVVDEGLAESMSRSRVDQILHAQKVRLRGGPGMGARRSEAYGRYIPWTIKAGDRNEYVYHCLLLFARARAIEEGQPVTRLSKVEAGKLKAFLDELDRLDCLVAWYDPDNPDGKFWLRRRHPHEQGQYVVSAEAIAS